MGSRWLDTVGLADPEGFWRVIGFAPPRPRCGVGTCAPGVRRANAGMFACSRPRRPGGQFLPNSDRYAVDSRPPAFGLSTCAPMDDRHRVHWIESLQGASQWRARFQRPPADATHCLVPFGPGAVRAFLCVTARADGHCIHSGYICTANTTPSICWVPFTCCARATIRWLGGCWNAYSNVKSVLMEAIWEEITSAQVHAEMLTSAILPEGKTLPDVLGRERYERADALGARGRSRTVLVRSNLRPGSPPRPFRQLQLTQLGFQPEGRVEMYFMERARNDGKSVAGSKPSTIKISLFQNMPLDTQAEYLVSSLEQAHDLPKEVDSMVHRWQRGDMQWFENQLAVRTRARSRL